MTTASLIAIIAAFGEAYSIKFTESHIYAFSYAPTPGCYGHPIAEASYSFESGVLRVSGPNSSYEKQIACKLHGDDECPACTGAGLI